jgi:chaperone BCS1
MTDVSGATEVDDDPFPPTTTTNTNTTPSPKNRKPAPHPLNLTNTNTNPNPNPRSLSSNNPHNTDPQKSLLPPAELAHIATHFASRIPPGPFSPAELQGFLLKRKKTPRRALEEVEGWVGGMVALKASRGRVLGGEVQ